MPIYQMPPKFYGFAGQKLTAELLREAQAAGHVEWLEADLDRYGAIGWEVASGTHRHNLPKRPQKPPAAILPGLSLPSRFTLQPFTKPARSIA